MGEGTNGTNGPTRSRRKAVLLGFLGIAVAVVAAGLVYRWYRSTHISTDDAYVEGRIHPVSARIPGKIVEVFVEDNQPVRRGQKLLRVDPEPYRIRVSAASAGLSASRADLSAARSDVRAARSDLAAARQEMAAAKSQLGQANARVAAARSGVAVADARFAQAGRDAERTANLFGNSAISRERYEKSLTDRDVARAQADAAREELRLAEAAVAAQEALIAQREAQVAQREAVIAQREAKVGQQAATLGQRKASLDEASLQQGYTDVVSPADGYVTRKNVEVGNVVEVGQPLLSVTSLADVWIVANYKETQLGRIRPGDPVTIRVDTYSDKTFRGRVDSIMAGTGSAFSLFPPENATGNYVKVVQRVPVKIVLSQGEDPGRLLRIGMSVVPTIRVR